MHVLHSDTAVDDFHTVVCQNVGNGAAAAFIYLAQFRSLVGYVFVIQNVSQLGDVFRIGVVGTGFTPCSRVFVKRETFAEICAVVLLHNGWIVRIEGCADIG